MPKGESPESLKKNKSLLISSFMSHLMSREPGAITKLVIVAPPLNAGGNGGEMAGKRGVVWIQYTFLGSFLAGLAVRISCCWKVSNTA
jgi:hypothetical protein